MKCVQLASFLKVNTVVSQLYFRSPNSFKMGGLDANELNQFISKKKTFFLFLSVKQ